MEPDDGSGRRLAQRHDSDPGRQPAPAHDAVAKRLDDGMEAIGVSLEVEEPLGALKAERAEELRPDPSPTRSHAHSPRTPHDRASSATARTRARPTPRRRYGGATVTPTEALRVVAPDGADEPGDAERSGHAVGPRHEGPRGGHAVDVGQHHPREDRIGGTPGPHHEPGPLALGDRARRSERRLEAHVSPADLTGATEAPAQSWSRPRRRRANAVTAPAARSATDGGSGTAVQLPEVAPAERPAFGSEQYA